MALSHHAWLAKYYPGGEFRHPLADLLAGGGVSMMATPAPVSDPDAAVRREYRRHAAVLAAFGYSEDSYVAALRAGKTFNQIVGGSGKVAATNSDAAFKAEYAADKISGITEADYILSRRATELQQGQVVMTMQQTTTAADENVPAYCVGSKYCVAGEFTG